MAISARACQHIHKEHLRQVRRALVVVSHAEQVAKGNSRHLAHSWEERNRQEAMWERGIKQQLNQFHSRLNIDGAVQYAATSWGTPGPFQKMAAFLRKAANPPPGPQDPNQPGYTPPNLQELINILSFGIPMGPQEEGALQAYIGMASETGVAAGQSALDQMGLHQTFEWAHPRNMPQSLYEVRGSKVVQNMYGEHLNRLSQIITDATDPRHPKPIQEVTRQIKEEWPQLENYQATRIARTETAAVWTGTQANAYMANGIGQVQSTIATGPSIGVETEDPCDECVDAAADVHSLTDDLPPWHPNCRCEIVPVLENPDSGELWLPPDEPWAGGDLPVCGSPLAKAALVQRGKLLKMKHVEIKKDAGVPGACATPLPEPGDAFGGGTNEWLAASADEEDQAAIDKLTEEINLTWTYQYTKDAAQRAIDSAREYQNPAADLTGAKLLVYRTNGGLPLSIAGLNEGDFAYTVTGLASKSGGARKLMQTVARRAYAEDTNLQVIADNISPQLRDYLSSIGFEEHTAGGVDYLRLSSTKLKDAFGITPEEAAKLRDEAKAPVTNPEPVPAPAPAPAPNPVGHAAEPVPSVSTLADIVDSGVTTFTGKVEVYRVGATGYVKRGVFFGDSPESVDAYASLHHGHEIKRYIADVKNAKVYKDARSAWADLFPNGKTFSETFDMYAHQEGVYESGAIGKIDDRIAAKLRGQGHDALIYTNPAPPAKYELALLKPDAINRLKAADEATIEANAEAAQAWIDAAPDTVPYLPPSKAEWAKAEGRTLRVSDLVATEKEGYYGEATATSGPIDVVHVGDKYYVEDGHHRVYAAIANGDKTIPARVVEGHPLSGAEPAPVAAAPHVQIGAPATQVAPAAELPQGMEPIELPQTLDEAKARITSTNNKISGVKTRIKKLGDGEDAKLAELNQRLQKLYDEREQLKAYVKNGGTGSVEGAVIVPVAPPEVKAAEAQVKQPETLTPTEVANVGQDPVPAQTQALKPSPKYTESKLKSTAVTQPEQEALVSYQSQPWVSPALRKTEGPMSDFLAKTVTALDSALTRAPLGAGTVFRGIRDPGAIFAELGLKTPTSLAGTGAEYAEQLASTLGRTFVDKGYLSTTIDKKFAGEEFGPLVMEINVEKGVHGIYLPKTMPGLPSEQELILQRDLNLTVREVRYDEKTNLIHMKVDATVKPPGEVSAADTLPPKKSVVPGGVKKENGTGKLSKLINYENGGSIGNKRSVTDRIAEQIAGDERWNQQVVRDAFYDGVGGGGYGYKDDLSKDAIAKLVHNWAITSSDADWRGLAVQQAIKDELGMHAGVFPASFWNNPTEAAKIVTRMEEQFAANPGLKESLQAFVRAQYEATQAYFKEQGIDEITVYRGMRPSGEVPWPVGVSVMDVTDNPAASWSTRISVSKRGHFYGGTMLRASVPADMVLGTPLTGFGCSNEYEVVVLNDGANKAWVVREGYQALTDERRMYMQAEKEGLQVKIQDINARWKPEEIPHAPAHRIWNDAEHKYVTEELSADQQRYQDWTTSEDYNTLRAAKQRIGMIDDQLARNRGDSFHWSKETELKAAIQKALDENEALAGKELKPARGKAAEDRLRLDKPYASDPELKNYTDIYVGENEAGHIQEVGGQGVEAEFNGKKQTFSTPGGTVDQDFGDAEAWVKEQYKLDFGKNPDKGKFTVEYSSEQVGVIMKDGDEVGKIEFRGFDTWQVTLNDDVKTFTSKEDAERWVKDQNKTGGGELTPEKRARNKVSSTKHAMKVLQQEYDQWKTAQAAQPNGGMTVNAYYENKIAQAQMKYEQAQTDLDSLLNGTVISKRLQAVAKRARVRL